MVRFQPIRRKYSRARALEQPTDRVVDQSWPMDPSSRQRPRPLGSGSANVAASFLKGRSSITGSRKHHQLDFGKKPKSLQSRPLRQSITVRASKTTLLSLEILANDWCSSAARVCALDRFARSAIHHFMRQAKVSPVEQQAWITLHAVIGLRDPGVQNRFKRCARVDQNHHL